MFRLYFARCAETSVRAARCEDVPKAPSAMGDVLDTGDSAPLTAKTMLSTYSERLTSYRKRARAELSAGAAIAHASTFRRQNAIFSGKAPVTATVHCYGDSASDHVDAWPVNQPLYQIQVSHQAYPSYMYWFKEAFNEYLWSTASVPEDPRDVAELERVTNIKFQVTRAIDGNNAGLTLVDYRLVVYVVGYSEPVLAVLRLLHGYVRYRSSGRFYKDRRSFPSPSEQVILVELGARVERMQIGSFGYPRVELVREERGVSHLVFDAAGPIGNQFLRLDLELGSDSNADFAWSGCIRGLGGAFDSLKIPLKQLPDGTWYRCMRNQRENLATHERATELLGIVTEKLRRFPCVVRIVRRLGKNGDLEFMSREASSFVTALSKLDNLLVLF